MIYGPFADLDPPQNFVLRADESLGNERSDVVGERCKQSQRLQLDLACRLLAYYARLPRRAGTTPTPHGQAPDLACDCGGERSVSVAMPDQRQLQEHPSLLTCG